MAAGRPRKFNREAAVSVARRVFLEHGYEGVSLFDLQLSLAIDKSSFYAAFQSKERLFREALELYRREVWAPALHQLGERGTARDAIESMLRSFACGFTQAGQAHGCLVVSGAANCAKSNLQLYDDLRGIRNELRQRVEARLESGVKDGDVPAHVDRRALAVFVITIHHGLALQAHDRVRRDRLLDSVRCAMAAWDVFVAAARPS